MAPEEDGEGLRDLCPMRLTSKLIAARSTAYGVAYGR